MIFSIRKFLLINLLLTITITTALAIAGNFYLDKRDVEAHMNTMLEQTAQTFHAFFSNQSSIANANQIQQKLNAIPPPHYERTYFCDNLSSPLKMNGRYQFQIWDAQGQKILHSSQAPVISLASSHDGLDSKTVDDISWQSYTIHDAKTGYVFVVAESEDTREILADVLNKDELYIVLITYPLAGILIWLIIGRGLRSLQQVAREVSNRAPNNLEPVGQHAVPVEIKPLIDELNKLFLKLQQAFEREQRFAADAAHELRTPLAAIRTQAQVALKIVDNTDGQAILHNVINGVDRATHIVQQLLTLSRLAPEALQLEEIKTINLTKLTSDITSQLAPSAIEKQIDIELIITGQTAEIEGNATALGIMLRNLVDNAIRYTPEGGRILVKLETHVENIILQVIDSGPGIPPELRSRVFERFYRILGTQSPGSGLGLAIVQKIASLHKAEVSLGSLPDNSSGLIVTVYFRKAITES